MASVMDLFFSSPHLFAQHMGVAYLPRLTFINDRISAKPVKYFHKAQKRGEISIRQKWLGAYYAQELEMGYTPELFIQWTLPHVGWGVFAQQSFPKGAFLGEYTGVLRRKKWWCDRNNKYSFDYTVGVQEETPFLIDAESSGNITRWINHSTTPNLESLGIYWKEIMHVVFLALRPIREGEQLSYDYGSSYWQRRPAPYPIYQK
jgi:uncharacterized protein